MNYRSDDSSDRTNERFLKLSQVPHEIELLNNSNRHFIEVPTETIHCKR